MQPDAPPVIIVADSPTARDELLALVRPTRPASAVSPADFTAVPIDADTVVVYDLAAYEPDRASDAFARAPAIVLLDARQMNSAIAALRAGARGVLPRDVEAGELIAAVEAAAHGYTVVAPELVALLLPPAPLPLDEPLSARERDVLALLARGVSNREIARALAISEHTVKFHVGSILAKLGAATRTEAVAIGIRRGLVML